MKTPIRTTFSLPIVIIGLCLGMMTGCHAGLDGPVLDTGVFHVGDLLRPTAAPADAGEEAPGRDEEERGGDAAPAGRGPVEAGMEGGPAVPAVAEGNPDAPEPPGAAVAWAWAIGAFTCQFNRDDPLCQAHQQDQNFDASKVVVVSWKWNNIKAAFMGLPTLDLDNGDRFLYTPFIGDIDRSYLGLQSDADFIVAAKFSADLLSDPLSGFDALSQEIQDLITDDEDILPFSFCETNTDIDTRSCFDGARHEIPKDQIIFFPLRAGETSRTGKWLLPINGEERSLDIGYTDPVGTVHTEKVLISRVLNLDGGIPPENVVDAGDVIQQPANHLDANDISSNNLPLGNYGNADEVNDGSGTRINVGNRFRTGTPEFFTCVGLQPPPRCALRLQ